MLTDERPQDQKVLLQRTLFGSIEALANVLALTNPVSFGRTTRIRRLVSALAEPGLKLPLVDRYLISAEKGGVRPIIVLNKSDLVDLAPYQWVIGLYTRRVHRRAIDQGRDG